MVSDSFRRLLRGAQHVDAVRSGILMSEISRSTGSRSSSSIAVRPFSATSTS